MTQCAGNDRVGASAKPKSPLAYPVYRNLWFGMLVSRMGNLMQMVAASWLMVSTGAGAEMVAAAYAATMLPMMIFALPAGIFVDSLGKRTVLLGAYMLMLGGSIAIALVALAGVTAPLPIILLLFLVATGNAISFPAMQTSVSEIVPRESVQAAVAINSITFNLAMSLGSALGGAVVTYAGTLPAFMLSAAGQVPMLIVLAFWVTRPPEREERESFVASLVAGGRYAAWSPVLLALLGRSAVFGLGASSCIALMPLVAHELLGGQALTYGLLLGAFGFGGIAGAISLSRVKAFASSETMVRTALTAIGTMALLICFSRSEIVTAVAAAVEGGCWVMVAATLNASVQLSTPKWVVGRVIAFYQMAALGSMGIGGWGWGWITERGGVQAGLIGAAALLFAAALLGLRFAVPDVAAFNLSPSNLWRQPELEASIPPGSGPVRIRIEYHIPSTALDGFRQAMRERAVWRRQNGAQGWELEQHPGDPDRWIERYSFATWRDYVGHNRRITADDAANIATLHRLHLGPAKPEVQRDIAAA